MEMFNREQMKRIAEETDLRRVALRVLAALCTFMADNSPNEDLSIELPWSETPPSLRPSDKNRVILCRISRKTLEILCDGPDAFSLRKTPGMLQQSRSEPSKTFYDQGENTTLEQLGPRVIKWLEESEWKGAPQIRVS
jgi:hypothetical protein